MFGNLFKQRSHYVYNYKPRYYDERKERLDALKNKYENKNKETDTDDLPKIKLNKDQLRTDWQRQKKVSSDRGVNIRLAIIIAIIIGILAYIFELHKLF